MKKKTVAAIVLSFMAFTALPAKAAESEMRTTLHDAFYGGLTGALVGAALLVFKDEPEDHLEYIAYGFGAGVVFGAAYGIARPRYAVAEINDGRFALNLPTLQTEVTSGESGKAIQLSADILQYKF